MATTAQIFQFKKPKIVKNKNKTHDQYQVLEYLLSNQVQTIILEGRDLSYKIRNNFQIVDYMHKTSVISGLIGFGFWIYDALVDNPKPHKLAVLSGLTATILANFFNLDWDHDQLSQYRILKENSVRDQIELKSIDMSNVKSIHPTVLVRVGEQQSMSRSALHNLTSFIGFYWPCFVCSWLWGSSEA